MNLINSLIKDGWLKTPEIIEAFKKIKREDFLPEDKKDLAELNEALPIGFGQTISQPLVVAFMLELLQPKKGDKILDVGFGSGWTSALLAEIVGKNGRVIAVEIAPELKKIGEKNAENYNKEKNAEFILGDGAEGFKKEAPYDKILASASIITGTIPKAWKNQLKAGGRIVCPIENSIWLFVKKSENDFEVKEYPGFVFVPLIQK
ncbi:MAG: protein-L-isoaspartate O-methyltransferase [Patescibacteria group bacterium]